MTAGAARVSLWVRCAGCAAEFDTGIRMSRRDFERATFAANYHRCPACRARGVYRKQDYRPRDESMQRPP